MHAGKISAREEQARCLAETLAPCRYGSRIITISPSLTNDLSPMRTAPSLVITADCQPQLSGASVSSPGENSIGTFGEYTAGAHGRFGA
jgi:hypothetical protein